MKTTIKIAVIAMMGMSLGVKAQWNTIDVGNSPSLTLFKHTGTSTPVPFNIQKLGYSGSSINYGLLHLDMGHNTIGGGSNLHFRLKNSSNGFKEYGGMGAYIIDNTSGSENGGLTFYTTNEGKVRIRRMTILDNGFVGIGINQPEYQLALKGKFSIGTEELNNKEWGEFLIKKVNFSENYASLGFSQGTKTNNLNVEEAISIRRRGNVGIGTNTPSEKLDIKGNLKITGDLKMSGSDSYIWTNGTGTGYTGIWDQKNRRVLFYTSEKDGNVGIGTTNTKGFKLGVNGKVAATEVKVATYSNWADFVFKKDYHLPTLLDVENHIKEKGHLKDIPSAKEVRKNGFFLGEMDAKLLQKIEELTLYTIEQEKKLNNQEEEIEELKKQNSKFEKQEKKIKRLESLVEKLLKDKN